jgi:dimethylglycine dehydrogenase
MFGALAVEAMRLEKGYLHWKADILTEFDPFETGLDRFVNMDKADFIGKSALAERCKTGPEKLLVTLCLKDDKAPAHGGASVMVDGRVVGTVTSGGYGHRIGKNLAYAFVDTAYSQVGSHVEIDVLGQLISAEVTEKGLYDPSLARVRA